MKPSWLISWHPEPERRPALLCLPQAGAGCGQFRRWQQWLQDEVAVIGVALPGREGRWSEPPATDIDAVLEAVIEELCSVLLPGQPLAVFGNSFGGLLGYELAVRLSRSGWLPQALMVAACRPPAMWVGMGRGLLRDGQSLADLVDARDFGDVELDPQTRELVLEVLGHDARLSLSYAGPEGSRLSCPLHAWGAEQDRIVLPAQLDGWQDYTSGDFRRRQFAGGHHFCSERAESVLPAVRDIARAALPAG
jgi:surfactin synthase thioesterase subunit